MNAILVLCIKLAYGGGTAAAPTVIQLDAVPQVPCHMLVDPALRLRLLSCKYNGLEEPTAAPEPDGEPT